MMRVVVRVVLLLSAIMVRETQALSSSPSKTTDRRRFVERSAAALAATGLFPQVKSASAVAPNSDPGSPRPLVYRVEAGEPMSLQPLVGRAVGILERKIAESADCVLVGAARGDAEDAEIAARVAKDLCFFAQRERRPVILAMEAAPFGTFLPLKGEPSDVDAWPAAGPDPSWLRPFWDIEADERIAIGVNPDTLRRIQQKGLSAMDATDRQLYVRDDEKFANYPTKTIGYDVYADRVIGRKYDQRYANDTNAPQRANYIASAVLQHEAAATRLANALQRRQGKKPPLVIAIVSDDDLKFGHGIQGRLERLPILSSASVSVSDDGAAQGGESKQLFPTVLSILCNPTAPSTYSLTPRLRLAITLFPENQPRKLADYLWFSASPPPNLIPNMFNPIDGQFKIDFGLSTGGSAI